MHSMEPSISFRIQAVDARALGGQFRHDQRIGPQPSYVDATQAHRNVALYRAQDFDDIAASHQQILERTKRRTTAARYWRTAILTFSHDAQDHLGDALPHEEARAAFEDFAQRHGVKLLSVDFHGDESAPHYHASFEGVTEAGYALRLNKSQLSREQDHAAAKFAELGLVRGKRKVDRMADGEDPAKWVNRSVRELHEQLPGELDALRAKIAKNERLAEKAHAKADEATERGRKAARNAERYEQRAAKAREALERLEASVAARQGELQAVEARTAAQRGELAAIEAQTADQKGELKAVEDAVAQKKRRSPA